MKESTVTIQIISKSGRFPVYATDGAAGADLCAYLPEPVTLQPGERRLIPTGLFIEIPQGVEAQIRASDYRGEWNIPLINWGQEAYTIHDGDRIAQAVFARYERAEFCLTESISQTKRGAGGFGHTGYQEAIEE